MRIWKETAAVSAAALLGVFLLPLAWAHEPVKVETPPELDGRQADGGAVCARTIPKNTTTGSRRCGCWTAIPSGI